jgi:multidrug efflux pump subunit AcrA (membrane-fusion protein)
MSNEADLELHRRLLDADPIAPLELAERYLFPLYNYLKRKFSYVEDEQALDAATMAIMSYVQNPTIYNPDLKLFFNFLKMAAEGDLRNELARQRRRSSRLVSLDSVALGDLAGNINIEEEVIAQQEVLVRLKEIKRYRSKANQSVADDEQDLNFLKLMQAEVRSTAEYSRVLGIEDLPIERQREIVKRNKDRLCLRLKRLEHKQKSSTPDEEDVGKRL